MLTDRIVYDSITILEDGQLQVRRSRVILDDGAEVIRQFHREVLVPGQDVSAYPARIQSLAAFVWTPAVIAAYRASRG